MSPAAPLPGMLRAVRSVQKAHYEVLTTGKGCGLSQAEMAKRLEDESGSRELYDALELLVNELGHKEWCDVPKRGILNGAVCTCPVKQAEAAMKKARGEV